MLSIITEEISNQHQKHGIKKSTCVLAQVFQMHSSCNDGKVCHSKTAQSNAQMYQHHLRQPK